MLSEKPKKAELAAYVTLAIQEIKDVSIDTENPDIKDVNKVFDAICRVTERIENLNAKLDTKCRIWLRRPEVPKPTKKRKSSGIMPEWLKPLQGATVEKVEK